MSQINRLQTIDAGTLQSTAYEPVSFVVDDLLPQGLHLLAGAPKIGKSWLALWLCLCAAQGKPLWTFATRPCEVLYLCLEDSFQRIQSRLFDLTEDAPPTLHFAVMSQQLHNGLVEQIEQFLKEHPQTKLIVIDTLQRIRTAGNDANPYASDYRDIGVLKALADKHRIAILLVHHLRKMNDDDPMNMISGTTGLSGATDSNFVLRKSKRRENTATLYCTGRDIPYRELALEFDGEDHVWKLLSDDCEQTEQPTERILFLLSELLRRQPEISAPAKTLLEKIDPVGTEGLTPNSFSRRIRKSVDALRRNGITVSFRKSNGDRLICLKRVDGVDDPATGNIVTIDPDNQPCFAVCAAVCAFKGWGGGCTRQSPLKRVLRRLWAMCEKSVWIRLRRWRNEPLGRVFFLLTIPCSGGFCPLFTRSIVEQDKGPQSQAPAARPQSPAVRGFFALSKAQSISAHFRKTAVWFPKRHGVSGIRAPFDRRQGKENTDGRKSEKENDILAPARHDRPHGQLVES